jgi:sarcosine oxidase subunit alpha
VVLDEGAQVMAEAAAALGTRPLGHVTSSYHSAVLGRSIALALVAGGRARMGQTLHIPSARGAVPAQVVSSVFYDVSGERLNG